MFNKTIVPIASICSLYLSLLVLANPVTHAQIRVTTPSFPSCSNPEGSVVATYNSGVHGIPGDLTTHTGKDTVYNLSADTLTQCFCSENADGIQTNWWKVSSLDFDEVEYLQNLGWIYIPNGADWGLKEAPYMAFNQSFSCKNNGDKKVNIVRNRNGNNDDHNEGGIGGIGEVLGASTIGEVLGLASTGDSAAIAFLISTGSITALAGLYILKRVKDHKNQA